MRLIDADALLEKMKLLCVGDCSECDYNTFLSCDIHCGLIDEQPTIEAVPVVWKQIAGFEGLYEISTLGHVRNNKGEIKKHGIKRTSGTCYKTVKLWKDGRYYSKYIHRLIAEAFIPNPENLPFINHKDEDGTNNSIDNLEWCTREYNVNYGTARERQAKKVRGKESEKRLSVIQYKTDGEFVAWYPSISHAATELGCSTSEISKVCSGKRKTARGYVWKYENHQLRSRHEKEGVI